HPDRLGVRKILQILLRHAAPGLSAAARDAEPVRRSNELRRVMAVTTPAPEPIAITTADNCTLELRRHRGNGRPVLLVHGASAASDTFRVGETATLVGHLGSRGCDVGTLDGRASMRRVRDIYCRNRQTDFTIDAAATNDVPAAIAAMRRQGGHGQLRLVGPV